MRTHLLALTGALLFGLATESLAAPITAPTGLNPGDQYRLAFVTSTTGNATSSSIADYNAFVTGVANTVPELVALGTTWTAIASTSAVAARDNTSTNPSVNGIGVPIFLLNDTKLADDNADLWDGSIDVPLMFYQTGAMSGPDEVWSGTEPDGTACFESFDCAMAAPIGLSAYGRSYHSHSAWVFVTSDSKFSSRRFMPFQTSYIRS